MNEDISLKILLSHNFNYETAHLIVRGLDAAIAYKDQDINEEALKTVYNECLKNRLMDGQTSNKIQRSSEEYIKRKQKPTARRIYVFPLPHLDA